MAEITLHFRNIRGKAATATVRTPVFIHFEHRNRKVKARVQPDSDITEIFLNANQAGSQKRIPPGVDVITDDGQETLVSGDGFEPGVCYKDKSGQTFCW